MIAPIFGAAEHEVWRKLYAKQRSAVAYRIHPLFGDGLRTLGITGEAIPDLDRVNERLRARTGFSARYVAGLESAVEFFEMLARGEFPIGGFIRDARVLSYTPAPDVFHDLFGHVPYLADPAYARFSREFGIEASKHAHDPLRMQEFERLYWFTMEFGIIRLGDRDWVFGSGIASSFGETVHALSDAPEIVDFDVESIRRQEFKIYEMQRRLYRLASLDQLYGCLNGF